MKGFIEVELCGINDTYISHLKNKILVHYSQIHFKYVEAGDYSYYAPYFETHAIFESYEEISKLIQDAQK